MREEIRARKVVGPGEHSLYGWYPGQAWWDYKAPKMTDDRGWHGFIVAKIYRIGDGSFPEFLALPFGCGWSQDGKERTWNPSWALCRTLEGAMDYCENSLVKSGLLPKGLKP